jgi:phenylacetate-CoA ligase
MRPVLGRRADRLEVRGVRFYPSQVERVLLEQAGIAPAYQLVLAHGDVDLLCEPSDPEADRAALAGYVRAALRDRLGLDMRVLVGAPGSVPRSPGKAVRVVAA